MKKINRGCCEAKNYAIEVASGEYILPLDGDDMIEPSYVKKAVKILNNNSEIGVVGCLWDTFGAVKIKSNQKEFDINKMIFQTQITNSSMFRKADFNKIGKYKEYMKLGSEDFELWLTFMEQGYEIYRINEVLFHRRVVIGSRTSQADKNQKELSKNIINKHLKLYLENDETYERILANPHRFDYKIKKYKERFAVFLAVSIGEFLIILLILSYVLITK